MTMSRIAGIFLYEKKQEAASLVREMLKRLQGAPTWRGMTASSNGAVFGWCGWRTPACCTSNGVVTVLDGFLYNRSELGEEQTDAGLFSYLYRRFGFEATLWRVNGDFAVALYDPRIDTLWLARDRFGVKPLYYVSHPERFAFASQPGALLGLADVSSQVDRRFVALFAACHYRTFDNDPERTPYEALRQLPPAHLLKVTPSQTVQTRYWSLQDLPDFTDREEELTQRYRSLLFDAVSLRLNFASRPAFTLSGGMDSSSVLASAVFLSGKKQTAFSAVYDEKTYDESGEIQSTVGDVADRWHPVSVANPDLFGLVQRMIDLHQEPVATATWLSHLLVCDRVVQEGFGSLFGGLGGDELNAGEYEHFLYYFADLRSSDQRELFDREVGQWSRYHDHPVFRKSVAVVEESFARLIDFSTPGRCLPDQRRLRRYLSALNPDYFDLTAFVPVMDHPFESYLKNRTYQDLTRETIPCCLRAQERQTTASGLDHFLPFFDHRLVEFMFRIPGTLKFRDGVAKYLLREAMRGVLPEETRTRIKKTGWNAPAHAWFSGKGKALLLDLVGSQSFRSRGIYCIDEVIRLIEEHERIVASGRPVENHMMFLWQLANLEFWFQSLEKLSRTSQPQREEASRLIQHVSL